MSISLKNKDEIEILAEGGRRLAAARKKLIEMIRPGVQTDEIDTEARELLSQDGDRPVFLGYTPSGADRPYPASVCISLNDEIVHGIPNEDPRVIKEGDLVSIDMGLVHKELITDTAYTVFVGEANGNITRLLKATQEALDAGISVARVGNRVGDISAAIEAVARSYDVSIFKELVGHGVGYTLHEDPYIPNIGEAGSGALLEEGLVIAIEPMFGLGAGDIKLMSDGYTYTTKDNSLSAHFEHTIVITKDGPRILTRV